MYVILPSCQSAIEHFGYGAQQISYYYKYLIIMYRVLYIVLKSMKWLLQRHPFYTYILHRLPNTNPGVS